MDAEQVRASVPIVRAVIESRSVDYLPADLTNRRRELRGGEGIKRMTNPIFSANRLKLGTFCTNGRGASFSLAPEVNGMNFPLSVKAARMADEAGLEAVVSFARWLGYIKGKPNHYTGDVMDPFAWAAAIAQATQRVGVFVTSHAPTIHPLLAARQAATIDVISGGRLGFNIVAGWNRHELEMFGAPLLEHEARYDYLAEWIQVIERLWTSDEPFDHDGEFFKINGGFTLPKPIQKPRPPIMNAGGSPRGVRFACRYADMCFVFVKSRDPAQIRADVDAYKNTAREEFGREVQVWTNAFVVQRETQKEAEDFLDYYARQMEDSESVDAWIAGLNLESKAMPRGVLDAMRLRFAAGGGGFPLVGTAARIAETLKLLSDCGIDGALLTWGDYIDGLERFVADVLPLLEQEGLREKFAGLRPGLGT